MTVLNKSLQALLKMAHPDTVWANANPQSAFPEQHVSMDLSDCSVVEITWCYSNSEDDDVYKQKIEVGKTPIC